MVTFETPCNLNFAAVNHFNEFISVKCVLVFLHVWINVNSRCLDKAIQDPSRSVGQPGAGIGSLSMGAKAVPGVTVCACSRFACVIRSG